MSDTRPPSVVARPSVCRSGETGTPVALGFSARHHRIVDSARRQLELPVPKELIDAIAERVADIILDRLADRPRGSGPGTWMHSAEVAQYLGWSRKSVYRRVARMEMPHYKIDGILLFKRMNSTPGSSSSGRRRDSEKHSASRRLQLAAHHVLVRLHASRWLLRSARTISRRSRSREHHVRFRSAAMSSTRMSGRASLKSRVRNWMR